LHFTFGFEQKVNGLQLRIFAYNDNILCLFAWLFYQTFNDQQAG